MGDLKKEVDDRDNLIGPMIAIIVVSAVTAQLIICGAI